MPVAKLWKWVNKVDVVARVSIDPVYKCLATYSGLIGELGRNQSEMFGVLGSPDAFIVETQHMCDFSFLRLRVVPAVILNEVRIEFANNVVTIFNLVDRCSHSNSNSQNSFRMLFIAGRRNDGTRNNTRRFTSAIKDSPFTSESGPIGLARSNTSVSAAIE